MKASTAFTYELCLAIILSCFLGYMIASTVMWSNHTCPERTSLSELPESSESILDTAEELHLNILELTKDIRSLKCSLDELEK